MSDDPVSNGVAVSARELEARVEGLRVQILDVEGQLNRRVQTAQREAAAQHEHFDSILAEKDRATEIAERERAKAADALAEALSRSIREGDERLREHITNQIQQIEAALVAAEKLLDAHVERLKADIASGEQQSEMRYQAMQDQLTARFESSEKAISKAEAANEKRFEDVNQWRQQSNERERAQQEQTLRLTSSFLPREVADAQFEQIRRNITELTEKLGRLA